MRILRLVAISIGAALLLSARAETAHAGDAPMVESITASAGPTIPVGLKRSCMVGPDTTTASTTCAVIRFRGRSYWPYSYSDNRSAISLVEYDSAGRALSQLVLSGARYPWRITMDVVGETLTIWGQSNATVTVAWEELDDAQSPVVMSIPTGSAPTLPADLKLSCKASGSSLANAANCPVVYWGGYQYWALSYTDNRSALAIVAYTLGGTQVMRWNRNGARYVWDAAVSGETVTFTGQSNASVTMTRSDMRSSGP